MISKQQAEKFMKSLTGEDKTFMCDPNAENEALLQKVIHSFHMKVPFQNVSLLAKPDKTHDVPTIEDIISDVLSFQGGLCYTNNVFMKYFLEVYGLKVHHIAATCNLNHPNNHILTKVQGLTEEDGIHLVDVGCGYPTFEPVAIRMESCSDRIFSNGFLKYKFMNDTTTSDQYERRHFHDFTTDNKSSCGKKWERYYTLSLRSRPLEYFKDSMEEVYKHRFLRKIRAIVFKGDDMHVVKESGCSGRGTYLVINTSGTCETELNTNEEIVSQICSLIPVIPADVVRQGVINWRSFQKNLT